MPFTGRTRTILLSAAAVVACLAVTVSVCAVRLQPWARRTLIQSLKDRYQGEVEVANVNLTVFPLVHLTGENLVIRSAEGRPMIEVKQFAASANFFGLMRSPHRASSLVLKGLRITVPAHHARQLGGSRRGSEKPTFLVDEIIADASRVTTTPTNPAKQPLVFEIHSLRAHRTGNLDAMRFHAELTNPIPPGIIETDGTFGPWNADDPDDSPVEGRYSIRGAQLAIFKGISGILNSDAKFSGKLESLEVQGTADVRDFALHSVGHEVPLHTAFNATVNGTDGDTVLHTVNARLGKSDFVVTGAIERGGLQQRKAILLEAQTSSNNARIEDFLRLALKSPRPPISAAIRFKTSVEVPPGEGELLERMDLKGLFGLGRVKFTSPDVEQKISTLSHRAEGDPKNEETGVPATLNGHFHLQEGIMHLPDVTFRVPGAFIALAGTYRLHGGALKFHGTAKLDATVSQMTTGIKKFLLKPVDPFFERRDAGAVVPIKIAGSSGSPSFSFDIGRALRK